VRKPESFTLRCLLLSSTRKHAERRALSWVSDGGYTYKVLERESLAVALKLISIGVRKGNTVALIAESRPEWGIAYLGITAAGFVAVPILPDFLPSQIENIIEHSDCKTIILSERQKKRLPVEFLERYPIFSLENIVKPPEENTAADDLLADPLPVDWESLREPEEEDLAAILYTSGTTGNPKGVMLTHKAIAFDVWASNSVIRVLPQDRLLSILPLAHTYECTVGFLTPIAAGAEIFYLRRPPSASVLLPALKEVRPTMMLSVPLVIEKIVRDTVFPKIEAIKLPRNKFFNRLLRHEIVNIAGAKLRRVFGNRLRFFGIGGAALASDVEGFLHEAHFPYAIGYGLTETSPLVAGSAPRNTVLKSTGKALRGVDVRLREGEIQVRGANVMNGYYRDEAKTQEAFTEDGWFRTGDLGEFDKKKRLFIRGRLKNMVLGPSGENIYPEEIEALINSLADVEDSIVYNDEEHGLVALVHLKDDFMERLSISAAAKLGSLDERVDWVEKQVSKSLEGLKASVNSRLAAFSRLKIVLHKSEPFEKTPSKKIKRHLYPNGKNHDSPKKPEK
jgi:long-chain acyl-CoA synthetase